MDIFTFINRRAQQRIKTEGLDALAECGHEKCELRRRPVGNGQVQYVQQCLRCGHSTGGPVAHNLVKKPVLDFDEVLAQRRYVSFERIYEIERQEFWRQYAPYLASDRWAEIRRKVLERENNVCQGCGGKATQAHHTTYQHAFNEFLFELIAICRACHERLHADLGPANRPP